jgi:hypothetical protein
MTKHSGRVTAYTEITLCAIAVRIVAENIIFGSATTHPELREQILWRHLRVSVALEEQRAVGRGMNRQ